MLPRGFLPRILLLPALVVAGCSQRSTPARTPAPSGSVAPSGVQTDRTPPAGATSPTAGVSPGVRPTGAGRSAAPALRPNEQRRVSGNLPLEVTVQPSCGSPGTPLRATIRTEPGALVAGFPSYSDGSTHGDNFTGTVEPSGVHIATWTINRSAPAGNAVLFVAASASGNRGASVEVGFEVRARC